MEPGSRPPTNAQIGTGPAALPLRHRMELTRVLLAFGGVLSFVGLIVVAAGVSQPVAVLGGFAFLSPAIAAGTVLAGFGVLLGFLGAAVKGPSREWSEVAPGPPRFERRELAPIRRCPNCGVHTDLSVCPECGRRVAPEPGP